MCDVNGDFVCHTHETDAREHCEMMIDMIVQCIYIHVNEPIANICVS